MAWFQVLMAEGALYLNAPQFQYILLVVVARMAEFMVILLVSMAVGRRALSRDTPFRRGISSPRSLSSCPGRPVYPDIR